MMSDLLIIDFNFTSTAASTATTTSLLAPATITSTRTARLKGTDEARATPVSPNLVPLTPGSILSAGAKTGISVGIGLLLLLLILAGALRYRQKKRQTPGIMSTGFEKPKLDGKTVMHTVAETDGSEIHQAPDSPATHRAEEVQKPVVQQLAVHPINQDPVE